MNLTEQNSMWMRFARVLLTGVIVGGFMVSTWQRKVPAAIAQPSDYVRYGGYGISVGPWLEPRPDLLHQMGMEWVKLYDHTQVKDFPNHRVLYRLTVPGYPPDWDLENWNRVLYDFANELEALGVDAVEIANEPNLSIEWGNQQPDPAKFVDVLRRAHGAFKQEAPGIVIVSGGLAPTFTSADGSTIDDFDYAQAMLDLGAAQYFDAFGYHPYGFNQPPEANPHEHPYSFRRTERMRQLLVNNGVRKPIWITEFGWIRDPAEDGYDCTTDAQFLTYGFAVFDAETQAAYTKRSMEWASRNWPWAGPMFLWNLNWNLYGEDIEPRCSHLRWYGILDSNGNPLPTFYALQVNPPPAAPEPDYDPGEGVVAEGAVYEPRVTAVAHNMQQTAEAGCAGIMEVGTLELAVTDTDPAQDVISVEAANAPGRPFVWTSVNEGRDGDTVTVFVDARQAQPGIHLVAVNLRAQGTNRMSSAVVRGWLLIHYPTTRDCVLRYERTET